MNQLMETLLYSLDSQQLEAEKQAFKASREAVLAAEKRLTYDEFEGLWNAIAGIERASEVDSFTLGFRLGVQLTLEGLRPLSPAEETSAPSDPPR